VRFYVFSIDSQCDVTMEAAKNITKISHYYHTDYHSRKASHKGIGVYGSIKVGQGIDNSKTGFYDKQLSVV
jgi:hypothetical protein